MTMVRFYAICSFTSAAVAALALSYAFWATLG